MIKGKSFSINGNNNKQPEINNNIFADVREENLLVQEMNAKSKSSS